MARRIRNPLFSRTIQRTLTAMTRTAIRTGSKAMFQALRAAPAARKPAVAKRAPVKGLRTRSAATSSPPASRIRAPASPAAPGAVAAARWSSGVAAGPAGVLRYRLYKPPGVRRTEHLPLLVMLHGCVQDAEAFAISTAMNRVAARERFLVLYPEQDRLSNLQGCWNWYDTRAGRAQREADTIDAAIGQVCLTQPVDPCRVALAGLSAGASMAALLAVRHPGRCRALVMHSGIAPGVAHSSVTALSAMRGRRSGGPLAVPTQGARLPALLVIQGSADSVVAPGNGALAARLWADQAGALPGAPRTVQRGARYAATVTDYRAQGRLVATLCMVSGLAHAWSGGAAHRAYSDPKGPDASRMIWAFAERQFAGAALAAQEKARV